MSPNKVWQAPAIAALLSAHGHLTPSAASLIASEAPSSSHAWMTLWLAQPQTRLNAHTLADWLAQTLSIPRASAADIDTAHNDHSTSALKSQLIKLSAPQGLVYLSEHKIGILDPADTQALQRIRFLINQSFEWRVVSQTEFQTLQQAHDASNQSKLFNSPAQPAANTIIAAFNVSNIDASSEDAPMVRYINDLMSQMVDQRASDVHFEPFASHYRIRARIDGVLHDIAQPDVALKEQIAVRLKVMAHLDIAEKRLPQDGRIKLQRSPTDSIDCRVSSMPTLFGEKIVVRFLNNQDTDLNISHLGYEPEQRAALEAALAQPHGLILMTGPTGSGKTVSLYACLNQLNNEQVNISSVEDPVEIFMSGINQVSINEKAGINFATMLRAFLRQDPDILMVGEIRDLETADISLKAAQTGHLVFSTLHTNDAPLALARLSQMGVTPYNIAASVSLITAQRLVRKLCSCKKPSRIEPTLLQAAGFSASDAEQSDWTLYAPTGCVQCRHSGFLGRIGVFQVLPISPDMQNLIANNASAHELRKQAASEGVLSLRQAGLLKVKAGLTTLDEVMAATL
ncbi:MAG: ATPase, T2SS/T4P/T4SS family [Formosimonas sp.]|jgi:type IV pilus assembly protein PilB